jgi:hypothetical protein
MRALLFAGCALVTTLLASWPACAEAPAPTPTPAPTAATPPRARSLAEYASQVRIDSAAVTRSDGVIGNDTVLELAEDAGMTEVHQPAAELGPVPTPRRVDPRVRTRWRKAYARQREAISRLVSQREALEAERDALRRRGMTVKALTRLDVVRASIERLDDDIAAARVRLSAIVSEARRDGATPAWFRGL